MNENSRRVVAIKPAHRSLYSLAVLESFVLLRLLTSIRYAFSAFVRPHGLDTCERAKDKQQRSVRYRSRGTNVQGQCVGKLLLLVSV
jgi:hypothetical protein